MPNAAVAASAGESGAFSLDMRCDLLCDCIYAPVMLTIHGIAMHVTGVWPDGATARTSGRRGTGAQRRAGGGHAPMARFISAASAGESSAFSLVMRSDVGADDDAAVEAAVGDDVDHASQVPGQMMVPQPGAQQYVHMLAAAAAAAAAPAALPQWPHGAPMPMAPSQGCQPCHAQPPPPFQVRTVIGDMRYDILRDYVCVC